MEKRLQAQLNVTIVTRKMNLRWKAQCQMTQHSTTAEARPSGRPPSLFEMLCLWPPHKQDPSNADAYDAHQTHENTRGPRQRLTYPKLCII
jgi:hypothetical protein